MRRVQRAPKELVAKKKSPVRRARTLTKTKSTTLLPPASRRPAHKNKQHDTAAARF
jgi:hypothetical protein